jgi:hypothetical protein
MKTTQTLFALTLVTALAAACSSGELVTLDGAGTGGVSSTGGVPNTGGASSTGGAATGGMGGLGGLGGMGGLGGLGSGGDLGGASSGGTATGGGGNDGASCSGTVAPQCNAQDTQAACNAVGCNWRNTQDGTCARAAGPDVTDCSEFGPVMCAQVAGCTAD